MNTQFVWDNKDGTFTDPILNFTGNRESLEQFSKGRGYDNIEILPIPVKNAKSCDLCGGSVDRYPYFYLCNNPDCAAIGDPVIGIMTLLDLKKMKRNKT